MWGIYVVGRVGSPTNCETMISEQQGFYCLPAGGGHD